MLVDSKRVLLKLLLWLLVLSDVFRSCRSDNKKATELMMQARMIDGHNSLPMKLRLLYQNKLSKIDLRTLSSTHTNIQKLQEGLIGAQFWSVFAPCGAQNKDAVRITLEQIDVIQRMCKTYDEFEMATSSQGIENTPDNKIACLMGIHGGHSIDSSLAALRMYYELGVRYMALTNECNTPWAQSSVESEDQLYSAVSGLSSFGSKVVKEMNRLGMMIDLSHASHATAMNVLGISKAPVIFTHSLALTVCQHPRNIPDDILQRLKQNNGLVMVTFHAKPEDCGGRTVDITTVIENLDYIRNVAGTENIGLSGSFDGVLPGLHMLKQFPVLFKMLARAWICVYSQTQTNFLLMRQQIEESEPDKRDKEDETCDESFSDFLTNRPSEGLEDISKYPTLIQKLLDKGWNEEEVQGILRGNFLRVFREVERVRDASASVKPKEVEIPLHMVKNKCRMKLKPPPRISILY